MKQQRKMLVMGAPILAGVVILVVLIASVGASGQGSVEHNNTAPDDEFQVEPVKIETIDVLLAESFPVQVFVEVTGQVPDPCWEPQEPVIEQGGNRIEVEIMAERDADEVCIQAIEDYSTTLALGTLEPGTYVVVINGVEQEFEVH